LHPKILRLFSGKKLDSVNLKGTMLQICQNDRTVGVVICGVFRILTSFKMNKLPLQPDSFLVEKRCLRTLLILLGLIKSFLLDDPNLSKTNRHAYWFSGHKRRKKLGRCSLFWVNLFWPGNSLGTLGCNLCLRPRVYLGPIGYKIWFCTGPN